MMHIFLSCCIRLNCAFVCLFVFFFAVIVKRLCLLGVMNSLVALEDSLIMDQNLSREFQMEMEGCFFWRL